MKLRWGILSTANIAKKYWKGISHSGNGVVTAVASRNPERSRQFITDLQREKPFESQPAAFGSYEELLKSPDVDAVYIPLPTGLRKEWVIRAAQAGKHVLCEKPCASSVQDIREMIDACRTHRVQFMDGVMFMHNPRLTRIRQALGDEANFGKLRRITSHFSFFANENFKTNIRSDVSLEPLGCLGDLGWYCVRFTLWTMNWRLPREIGGRLLSQNGNGHSQTGVPFDFSVEMVFDGDVSAGFFCSFLAAYSNWTVLTGTKGHVRVPDFVLPQKSSQGACEINSVLHDDLIVDPLTGQETNMIRAFADQVLSGKLNEDWPDWALKTQIVTNACLEAAQKGHPVKL